MVEAASPKLPKIVSEYEKRCSNHLKNPSEFNNLVTQIVAKLQNPPTGTWAMEYEYFLNFSLEPILKEI